MNITAKLGLQRLFQEACRGFHNTSLKPLALFLNILGLEVLEIRHAESATDRIDVEIDVSVPFAVESAEHIRSDSASFGTTEPLQFPDIRH